MKVISEKRRMNKLDINVSIKSKSLILKITKYAYGRMKKQNKNIFENDVHALSMTYSNKTLQYR